MCDSEDLTLQAILSNGVATVRQTIRRIFSAMAAAWTKKRCKLVLTPDYISYPSHPKNGDITLCYPDCVHEGGAVTS
jgi:hypothetical protein